ncbi:MAG: response regulator transcription factor [Candidatus Obscuribacterales bacterium]|nr:response regulator transcription factor [Candidatus Obscuribacterales bacterium]
MAKILIAEDDLDLGLGLCDWLIFSRHTVEWVKTGEDALNSLKHSSYDLIILDWNLPGISGIEVCKRFRDDRGSTPILMLTGMTETKNKTMGLDSGADDYLIKPFHLDELSARMRALLRRSPDLESDKLVLADIVIDSVSHNVQIKEQPVKFLPSEFKLLEFLVRNHKNPPFSPEVLLMRVWQGDDTATVASVRTCAGQVRKKLADANSDMTVESVRGIGYRISQNP